MKPYGLHDDPLTPYRDEGFVVVSDLFDREELRVAEDAIDDLTERAVNAPANLAEVLELEPEPIGGRRILRHINTNPVLDLPTDLIHQCEISLTSYC